MGNSNSTSNTNTNNSSSSGHSADVLLAAETETKTDVSQVEDLEEKVRAIEVSLKKDKSQGNIIAQFANVVEIEGLNKMDCVTAIVNSMGNGWREIMDDEEELTKLVGHTEMTSLKNIRGDYFYLLLKTKIVISGLLVESEMQKEFVSGSLSIVNKAINKGEAKLTAGDRLEYDESVKYLMKWIDQTELFGLTKEWNALMKNLQAQKSSMEIAAAKVVDTVQKTGTKVVNGVKNLSTWKKVALGLTSVIFLGGVICSAIVTAGTAAIVVGAVVCTIVAGGVGTSVCGYFIKPSEMEIRIGKITRLLDEYIQTCKDMQGKLNGMDVIQGNMKHGGTTLTAESCFIIRNSLNRIDGYLDAYIKQGHKLVVNIGDACKEFINN